MAKWNFIPPTLWGWDTYYDTDCRPRQQKQVVTFSLKQLHMILVLIIKATSKVSDDSAHMHMRRTARDFTGRTRKILN